jgi:hypothetical protein
VPGGQTADDVAAHELVKPLRAATIPMIESSLFLQKRKPRRKLPGAAFSFAGQKLFFFAAHRLQAF